MPLEPGDNAAVFSLDDRDGAEVTLSFLKGRKVLVYFHPGSQTSSG